MANTKKTTACKSDSRCCGTKKSDDCVQPESKNSKTSCKTATRTQCKKNNNVK